VRTVVARYASTCKLCEKPTKVGQEVTKFLRAWVHVNCAERHLEQNRHLTDLPEHRGDADRPQMTYVKGTRPDGWNGLES